MKTQMLAVCFMAATLAPPGHLAAAENKVIEVDWAGMAKHLTGSEGRKFQVVLTDGRKFRTTLLGVEDDGLVVQGNKRFSRSEIAAVQQTGRRGWGRLIGALAGAALMAAVVACPGKRTDTVEDKRFTRGEAAASGSMFVGFGFLFGYLADKPYPELRPFP
jgi:hypothetical protein